MADKNVFGQPLWQKKKAIQTIGVYAKRRILNANELRVSGEELLRSLPERVVPWLADVLALEAQGGWFRELRY